MDELQKKRLQKVLTPLLMCSVEQRYAMFFGTKTGRGIATLLNFEGSVSDVIGRLFIQLDRFGMSDKLIEEFEKLPKPEWYKE